VSGETERFDLAGIGSMVVDAIHRAPRLIGPDEKMLLEPHPGGGTLVQRLVGGVVLNQLGWARVLGLRVAVFGKQADDADGAFLRAGMDRLGIERQLDLSGSASSFAQIYVDPQGRRGIYMARGATGEITPGEIDRLHRPVIERAKAVCTEVSQLPLAVVRRVLERARAAGVRTIVDLDVPLADAVPSLGSERELHAVLSLADWIKPSLSATGGIVSAEKPREIAAELARRYGARAVLLTVGGAGSVVFAEGVALEVAAPAIRVVDSTGAGDAFLGGFVAGVHYGLDWEDAARLGNSCGAACCERVGAFPDDAAACRARALEHYRALGGKPFGIKAPAPSAAASAAPDALDEFLAVAVRELERSSAALDRDAVARVVALVRASEAQGGRVHVTGIGKSAHVAAYAAALLASTGTPATLLDASEATHGSVGQLRPGDVVIALSNSGETAELVAAARAARAMGARLVALCGTGDSSLAREAEVVVPVRVEREGGPLGLAPRASVLAQTLACAALSVALQSANGLTRQEYALRHPAGTLGRRSSREE
jgi:arabinose-5-phosphate isomerase